MHEALASILAGWATLNFVDGAWNLGTFYKPEPENKRTDGWSFQKDMGIDTLTCRLAAVFWHVWFGFHLLIPSKSF